MHYKNDTIFHQPATKGLLMVEEYTGTYRVYSTFTDRLAGYTVAETIWSGQEVNSAHISRLLVDEETRRDVIRFFATRELINVVTDLLPGQQWQMGGYQATLAEMFASVMRSTKGNRNAASVLMEMLAPSFTRAQILVGVAERRPIVQRFTYPFVDEPTIAGLVSEISRAEIERSVSALTVSWNVEERRRYSTRALANTVADAFFPLAAALHDAFDFDAIVNDIIKAVRVRIDPIHTGLTGDVPRTMLEHPTVLFLETNATFIRAALNLGTDREGAQGGITTSITPTVSEYRFDKWAGPILALLKSSDRYAIDGRMEALRSIGIKTVEDLRNVVRGAVVFENAEMEPVALGVVAVEDATMPAAWNIFQSKGRVDAHIAASYGNVHKELSVSNTADHLANIMGPVVEESSATLGVYSVEVRAQSLERIATLLADHIMYKPGDATSVLYRLTTTKRLELTSGVCVRNEVYTSDPVEVILAYGDKESVTANAMPQLLPKAALNSHLFVEANTDVIVRTDARYSFDQTIGHVTIRGSMKMSEFEHARHDIDASLVKPAYNDAIFNTCWSAYRAMISVTEKAPETMRRRLRREYTHYVVRVARAIASSMRGAVHAMLMRKSMSRLEEHEIQLMRARFHQAPVMAYSDLVAAAFFFGVQGIGQSPDEVDSAVASLDDTGEQDAPDSKRKRSRLMHPLFTTIWTTEDLREAMIDYGSSLDMTNVAV